MMVPGAGDIILMALITQISSVLSDFNSFATTIQNQ